MKQCVANFVTVSYVQYGLFWNGEFEIYYRQWEAAVNCSYTAIAGNTVSEQISQGCYSPTGSTQMYQAVRIYYWPSYASNLYKPTTE